jgi:hypothetical protein
VVGGTRWSPTVLRGDLDSNLLDADALDAEEDAILRSDFFKCCRFLGNMMGRNLDAAISYPDDSSFIFKWWPRFVGAEQKYAITDQHKLFVAVHNDAQVGDVICVLSTARVPLVVRKQVPDDTTNEEYIRLGTAYVHDVMNGEAWSQEEKFPRRTYTIV